MLSTIFVARSDSLGINMVFTPWIRPRHCLLFSSSEVHVFVVIRAKNQDEPDRGVSSLPLVACNVTLLVPKWLYVVGYFSKGLLSDIECSLIGPG